MNDAEQAVDSANKAASVSSTHAPHTREHTLARAVERGCEVVGLKVRMGGTAFSIRMPGTRGMLYANSINGLMDAMAYVDSFERTDA